MPPSPPRRYSKPALTPVDLVVHLQNKGLNVPVAEVPNVVRVLETVGYYRLLIYCRALQDPATKTFRLGTTFANVVDLYTFDRKLRLLCLDAIERIEVALKASINNRIAVADGPHFHMDAQYFKRYASYHSFLTNALKAQHQSIRHFNDNYDEPEVPPIWSLTEALSFGKVSRLFADLKLPKRKLIAHDFGWDERLLVSWFRCLTELRNRCAHHDRVWNARMLANMPSRSKKLREMAEQDRFYARAILITVLLRHIEPGDGWRNQLKGLIAAHTFVDPASMGFPSGWDSMPF